MLSCLALLCFCVWALFMPLPVGFAYSQWALLILSGLCLFSVGFAYSDLNKSFIPPMLPSRFVASYGR